VIVTRTVVTLALAASLVVVPACATEEMGSEPVAAAELAVGSSSFLSQTEIVGSLAYGDAPVKYTYKFKKNGKPRRAYKFAGTAGDHVVVDVKAVNGQGTPIAGIYDNDFNLVGDVVADAKKATLDVELPANASDTHYLVFRDYYYENAKFQISLTGTPAAPATPGYLACQKDADCTITVSACCPKGWVAVAKGHEGEYLAATSCEAGVMCIQMMPVESNDVAQCNNNTKSCELVDPLAIACGGHTINMHSCPDGFVCNGAGLKFDATGTCRKPCGGFGANVNQCGAQEVCVDDPTDDCDAETGGRDCMGVCQPAFCGGFGNLSCPAGLECIDDPNDSCDVNNGGADCGSICATH
jgi:hypothetical protein